MFRIALINMPFANFRMPSIGLTQLRSVLTKELGDQVSTDICYLNHEFVEYFGQDHYARIADSSVSTVSGVGDWLFRQAAFPEQEDNASLYVQRYARTLDIDDDLLQAFFQLRMGLDAFLDKLIDQYQLDQYSLVGFTSMFAQNVPSFALARKLKERNGDLVTVIGGANCESSMGAMIARNVEAIDFVFSGPALKTLPSLVQSLVDGQRDECHEIRGVFSKEKLSRNPLSDLTEIGEELDINVDIPLDYEGFMKSLEQRLPGVRPSLLFETSRGCWWGQKAHCTFCGLNGTTMNYRAMEPTKALQQFEKLFAYSPQVTRYDAVDNILPRQYLKTVLPHLKSPKNAQIFYEVKADLKDHEMKILADARVTEIQPGVEALASSTLKLMKKGTTAFHNLRFLKNCLIYGINPAWNLLVGFPGEQEDVYRKYVDDLPLLVHLPAPGGPHPVRFDRFSPYFTLAEEYGLKLVPCAFYEMIYPFPARDLADLAYFFVDDNYENEYIATTAKWIEKLRERCEHWVTRWYQRDGKEKPCLIFKGTGADRIVYDTRTGQRVEHELDPTALRLLDCLDEPMSKKRLAENLSDLTAVELDHQLDEIQKRGLVFSEEERLMSLVVDAQRGSATTTTERELVTAQT